MPNLSLTRAILKSDERPRLILSAGIGLLLATAPALLGQSLSVGPNVDINRQTGYQAEEAVAIDPTNPNRLFAWSNTVNSNNSAAYSTDGGATWTARLTGSDGWSALGGDPTCSFDGFGNLYGASFSSTGQSIYVRSSVNGGQTFASSLLTIGNGGVTDSLDQPTIEAGPGLTGAQQSVWISYVDASGLVARGAAATSLGGVGAFGTALSIPGTSADGNFGDVAIGPNGKVAVAYQTPTGGAGPSTIKVATNLSGSISGSFATAAASVTTNVGGFRAIPAQPNRKVDAETGLAYDNSSGAHRGRLFMTYTDAATTTSNDLNIFERYSDNDGATWSSALRVNTDSTSRSQFFPKMALDPVTGDLAIVWYDCRNSSSNDRVELWGTVSLDGGLTFLPEVKISAGSTTGVNLGGGNELGDYIGLDFYNKVFYPSWADDSNSTGNNPNGTSDLDYYGAAVTVIPEPGAWILLSVGCLATVRRRRPELAAGPGSGGSIRPRILPSARA